MGIRICSFTHENVYIIVNDEIILEVGITNCTRTVMAMLLLMRNLTHGGGK